MSTTDLIVIAVVAAIIALAIYKMVRDKQRGVKCSGCGGCSDSPGCCECSDKSHK